MSESSNTNVTTPSKVIEVGERMSLSDMAEVLGHDTSNPTKKVDFKSEGQPNNKKEEPTKKAVTKKEKAPEVETEQKPVNPLLAKKKSEEVETEEKAEGDEKEEPVKADDPEVKGPKKFTLKTDKEKYNIPSDAKIPVKVDGEEVEMTLEELRNKASGAMYVEKEITKLSQERKAFLEDKTATEEQLTEIISRFSKDPLDAVVYLAELAGHNPIEFRKNIDNSFYERYRKYAEMDETEAALAREKELNSYYVNYTKSKEEHVRTSQAQKEAEYKAFQLREAYNINDNEYQEAVNFLSEVEGGKYKEMAKDPEKVVNYIDGFRRASLAEQALKLINPTLANNEKLINVIADELREYQDVTVEQVAEYLRETYMLKSPNEEKAEKITKELTQKIKKTAGPISTDSDKDDEDDSSQEAVKSLKKKGILTLEDLNDYI